MKVSGEIGNNSNGITPMNTWMNCFNMVFTFYLFLIFVCVCLYVSVARFPVYRSFFPFDIDYT